MQVTGKFSSVVDKVRASGPLALYNGSIAASSATFVGHYPWFFTYNFLSEKIPEQDDALSKLGRRAILGFCSSAVSDTCSNENPLSCMQCTSHCLLHYVTTPL